jgi:ABC-type antimicrobial peptide transport system permease subunit
MRRALIGAGIGAVVGLLALAAFGAWAGYAHGREWVAGPAPPPEQSAFTWAFIFTAYYWWLAGAVGGLIGGLAGLGSSLVRPKPPAEARADDHPRGN